MSKSRVWIDRLFVGTLSCCLTAAFIAGCGGGDPAPQQQQETASTDSKPKSSGGSSKKNSDSDKPEGDGRKSIDGIPYDVFYTDPFAVVAQNSVVGATVAAAGGANDTEMEKPAEPEPEETAGGGGDDWGSIMPAEILDGEVKRIRNRMNQYMQSIASFKQNIFQLPADAATLSVLANIAAKHPGNISWKANAKFVRDLSYKMVEGDLKPDKATYDAVSEPFQNLIDVLGGNTPPGLEDSEEFVLFSEVSDFGALMKRLDRGEKWAKTNCGSEDSFKEEVETAESEGYVIAAISKVISTEGFGYFEDEDFLAHSKPMYEAAIKMAEGAKSGEFAVFDAGINAVSQKCTQCHTEYRE